MHIIDLHGKKVGVTDLQLAIMQADDYRHYRLSGPANQKFYRRQQTYWEDFYVKLLLLENQLNSVNLKHEP
ncbi:hypothetical protein FHW88_005181 [Mucilaginibacter sp. SG538B]|uniref:hypothetical protein n=1 Tax=Mucilaginibacter sp. SG538B TaxID=2587021 RepID=UPI00159D3EEC|nr:hypothetical protein [Mucilaginibacter sp. SG538B]NVM66863.1 hypothetical protein [Mucilaginibacter sp. SG538B]